jgi:hypothetical protein
MIAITTSSSTKVKPRCLVLRGIRLSVCCLLRDRLLHVSRLANRMPVGRSARGIGVSSRQNSYLACPFSALQTTLGGARPCRGSLAHVAFFDTCVDRFDTLFEPPSCVFPFASN